MLCRQTPTRRHVRFGRFALWALFAVVLVARPARADSQKIIVKAPPRKGALVTASLPTTLSLERAAWTEAEAAHDEDGPVLWLQFPVDGRVFYAAQARYSGCTEPGARVSVNGRAAEVYPDGAFAGLVDLEPGVNSVNVVAVKNGASTSRTVEVRRIDLQPLPASPARVASDRRILPEGDQVLAPGDVLTVQCEASPGADAWFQLGARKRRYPMSELSVRRHQASRAGFYRGTYVVQPGDPFVQAPIRIFVSGDEASSRTLDDVALKGTKRVRSTVAPGLLTTEARYAQRVARVTRDDTGLYTDSAGSIRLTSILEGTRLPITGRRGDMLRVALGETSLWVMSKNVRLLRVGVEAPKPPFISFPDVERPDSSNDIVLVFPTLTLSGDSYSYGLPFRVETSDGGSTVVLTLWNATAKPGDVDLDAKEPAEMTGHEQRMRRRMAESGLVRAVSCRMPDARTVEYSIRLASALPWGFDVAFDAGRCSLRLKAPPRWHKGGPLAGLRVYVDAGHGGQDTGAVGPAGLCESHVNFEIARRLEGMLKKGGARVRRTRRDDSYVSLDDRTDGIRESGVDMMISIHNNSIGETSDPMASQGPLVFYYHPHSRALAEAIFRRLPSPVGPRANVSRGVRYRSFRLTRACHRQPAVLIEGLFLSHPAEEMRLLDPEFLDTLSRSIYKGVVSYVEQVRPPRQAGSAP